MRNAIGLIKADLQRHKVEVILPGEKNSQSLYLIILQARTKMKEDLLDQYYRKNGMTLLQKKLIEKLFGEDEADHEYGVFINDELKMVFAFNRKFADYNKETKQVEFMDIDKFLIQVMPEIIGEKKSFKPKPHKPKKIDLDDFPLAPFPPRRGGSHGGQGVIRYSLTVKE